MASTTESPITSVPPRHSISQAVAGSALHTSQVPLPIETSRITSGKHTEDMIELPSNPQPLMPHACNSDKCTMETVLGTTELLEQILTHFQPVQILPLQLVKKKWNDLINDSPSLYLNTFVEPRWGRLASNFQLLRVPSTMSSGLTIQKCEPVHLGQWVEVRMDREAASRLNKLCHDEVPDYMITQPPTKSMLAFLVNANEDTPEQDFIAEDDRNTRLSSFPDVGAHHKIYRDSGNSLGQLAHHANRVLGKHKHREKTHMVFRAIVSFTAQTDAAPRKRSTTTCVTTIEGVER